MQLRRLTDQSSRKHTNADGGQQIGVVLPLLQPSDIGLSGVKNHSFGHAGWQSDLDFNVEFSSEHVFGRDIKDKELSVLRQFTVDGVGEADVGHGWLSDQYSVDEANRERLVPLASEEHFEGVIDEGVDPDGHGYLTVWIDAAAVLKQIEKGITHPWV